MLRQSASCRLDRIMKLIKYTHWISLERSEKNKQDMCKTYLPPKASTLYKFMSASRHFVSSWQDFHTCSCLLRCIKSPFFRKKLWSGERKHVIPYKGHLEVNQRDLVTSLFDKMFNPLPHALSIKKTTWQGTWQNIESECVWDCNTPNN